MKKIFLLFASALLSLGAMANVEFTFTRGADKAATVTAPEGLAATMESNVAWLTGGTMASRMEVLCPNRNTSQASGDNYITYTLTVSGLAPNKEFAAAKFTNIAVNSGGNLQPSNNTDTRHCNFNLTANGAEVASLTDQNIWIAAGQTDRTVTLVGTPFTADAAGNLTLVLKLAKGTSNDGCFYGLTKVELLDAVHTFSADKVYYIQWKNTGANYITESRGKSLAVADKKNSKYQFWRLIPVEGKSHCYYIQNVVTNNYIETCNKDKNSKSYIYTSTEKREYYIGQTTSTSANIAGCYYMSSTDCADYSDESKNPLALNKDGGSNGVLTWTAGHGSEGSYWKIVETTEEWQPPVHGSSAKNLTVYFRPCGVVSNTYLTAATISGADPVAYTASAKPDNFYVPYSKDHGAVVRGSTFEVSITLSSADDADLKANAYFDWNADGEFETTEAIILDGTAGTATVTVPADAVSGDTRMRIRLNSNGLDRADDDVEGFVYDISFAVVGGERKVLVDVNASDRGTATLSANAETYAVGTQLTATATPKGNATFHSWREGGVVVSREATYTFAVANRNMTLKAYFAPNTEEPEAPETVAAQWDFTFTRTSTTEATVAVTRDGAPVEGVTATIAIAPTTNYLTAGKLAGSNGDGYTNGTGILCINKNTNEATEATPHKYTLTISNATEEAFAFSYAEFYGVGVTSQGEWQSASAPRQRYFKVKHGDTTLDPRIVSINDAKHCNGKETINGFNADMVVPAGGTYAIELAIYGGSGITGDFALGCFYGLTKIALGAVPNYAVTVEGTEEAEAGVTYGNTTYNDGSTLNATLALAQSELKAAPVEGYKGSVALDKALGTILVTYQEIVAAQWDFTFNRTSTTEATATVTSKGTPVEGVTATIAIAGGDYQNQNQTASNMGILCINRNTTLATEADPNKYTLTITNNSDKIYIFDYAAVAGVALNSSGAYQGVDTNRDRYFKVDLGETALPAELLRICDNAHCSGKETFHAFAQPITIASGKSYTIQVGIYTDGKDGCFYGLKRIALGGTSVSIGSTGYTTLYTPIAMTVPESVSIYKGDFDEEASVLTLTAIEAGTAIPHETAVIIEGEPSSKFTYEVAARNTSAVAGNDLKGTHAAVATSTVITDTQEPYTLQSDDNEEGVAFKRFIGNSLAGGKAYLMLPKSLATQQKAVRIRFADGSTGIEHSEFTIQNSGFIYDLQGRRVLNPTKGIYIVGGKKVVIND